MNKVLQIVLASAVMLGVTTPALAYVNTNPPLIDPATGFSYATGASSATSHTGTSVVKKKKTTKKATKKATTKKVTKAKKATKIATKTPAKTKTKK